MVTITNSPRQDLLLRLEARKSLALGLFITDSNDVPLDITGTSIRLVVKKYPFRVTDIEDEDNLLATAEAVLDDAELGYARFFVQAADLNRPIAEYPFAIVLIDEGYSTVLVRGTVELIDNPEFSSIEETYDDAPGFATALKVALRGRNVVRVATGPTLAPGVQSFTDADRTKLDGIASGAQVNPPDGRLVPEGGHPGEFVVRLPGNQLGWAAGGSGQGGAGLDATGVPQGEVPIANGVGSWSWDPIPWKVRTVAGRDGDVILSLNDIQDTGTRLALTPTERTKIAALSLTPAWSAITDKPAFGTAALRDDSYFLRPNMVSGADVTSGKVAAARLPKLTEHEGFSFGTAAPSGGQDGDFYFQPNP